MTCPATAIQFARSNVAQADLRPFRAPDRTISIPDSNRRAEERSTGGQHQNTHSASLPLKYQRQTLPSRSNAYVEATTDSHKQPLFKGLLSKWPVQ